MAVKALTIRWRWVLLSMALVSIFPILFFRLPGIEEVRPGAEGETHPVRPRPLSRLDLIARAAERTKHIVEFEAKKHAAQSKPDFDVATARTPERPPEPSDHVGFQSPQPKSQTDEQNTDRKKTNSNLEKHSDSTQETHKEPTKTQSTKTQATKPSGPPDFQNRTDTRFPSPTAKKLKEATRDARWNYYQWAFQSIVVDQHVCDGRIEHIGEGDGSKYICNIDSLAKFEGDCVIHSYGANFQVQFDQLVKRRTRCDVHSFDITPSLPAVIGDELRKAGVVFHLLGIGDHKFLRDVDGVQVPIDTVPEIMKQLNHTRLDIIKMDVEGAEYESLLVMAESENCSELPPMVQQVLIELHVWQPSNGPQLLRLITALEANCGFRAFYKEPNPGYPEQCWEVSYVRPVSKR